MNHIVDNIIQLIKGQVYLRNSKKIGRRPRIRGKLFIDKDIRLYIGDKLQVWSFFDRVCFLGEGELKIGSNCFINNGVIIECRNSIEIGNNTKIGYRVLINDSNNHSVDGIVPVKNSPIKIGDNVWISSNSTILSGVTIGENAVVAAGAIVTKNVPKNTLVAGVPAKVIREFKFTGDRRL